MSILSVFRNFRNKNKEMAMTLMSGITKTPVKTKDIYNPTPEEKRYANYLYHVTYVRWYNGTMSWWLDKVSPEVEISYEEFSCIPYGVLGANGGKNITVFATSDDAKPVRSGNTISVGLSEQSKIDMIEKKYRETNDFYLGIILAQEKQRLGIKR